MNSFRGQSVGGRIADIAIVFIMFLIVAVTLLPMVHIAAISLSDGRDVLRGEVTFLPSSITLDSYRVVLGDSLILRSLWNSLLYTGVGTFVNLFMTALCAYPLARMHFSGRKVGTWIVTITLFFSGGLIPLYLLVLELGMMDSMWAIVLPSAITPWYVFLMRTYFSGIPKDIFDAAAIDGASETRMFWEIALPLAKPMLATLLLFYAVGRWNSFFDALLFLNDQSKFPLQLVLRNMLLEGGFDQAGQQLGAGSDFAVVAMNLKYAAIMVSTLPILLVYPFVQRYFVKGVMIGSLKG